MRAKSFRAAIRLAAATLAVCAFAGIWSAPPSSAQSGPPAGTLPANESRFNATEIVNAGHNFFGTVLRGLAQVVEKAVSQ